MTDEKRAAIWAKAEAVARIEKKLSVFPYMNANVPFEQSVRQGAHQHLLQEALVKARREYEVALRELSAEEIESLATYEPEPAQ
jgi:hypothetical protein